MAQQDQMQALAESNNDLVGYVQDYQGQIAEKTFQLVQANGHVRKLQGKLDEANEELERLRTRVAELEPAPEPEKAPAKGK